MMRAPTSVDVTATLARVLLDVLSLSDAALVLRESEDALARRFDDSVQAADAAREAIRLRLSGEFVEARAAATMPQFLDRLQGLLADPDTSPSMVLDVGKELAALAGSKVRTDARVRKSEGVATAPLGPLVRIVLSRDLPPISVSECSVIESDGP
ncbi:hypothetical protein [Oleiagrimonas sp.]|jgi:hypothetical protein|uniref:hypothetical protein n=1 Tax=Oleiagrimonas sp. TaxID=2010330 RepID=UPI00260A4BE4|nr:hypothetical protein [Oleiagrimonas sp.]MDA3914726.1 hypothetical protein [Oleiagrimonas sp.]